MTKSINFTFTPATNPDTEPAEYFKEYRQQLDAHKASLVSDKAVAVTEATVERGVEVALDEVVKRTRTGQWNTQSTMGKVVFLLDLLGWELKTGRSSELVWLGAAHHSKRVYVVGSRITLNGETVTLDQLKERIGI